MHITASPVPGGLVIMLTGLGARRPGRDRRERPQGADRALDRLPSAAQPANTSGGEGETPLLLGACRPE